MQCKIQAGAADQVKKLLGVTGEEASPKAGTQAYFGGLKTGTWWHLRLLHCLSSMSNIKMHVLRCPNLAAESRL